jgi:trimeric autotransporter adhesin
MTKIILQFVLSAAMLSFVATSTYGQRGTMHRKATAKTGENSSQKASSGTQNRNSDSRVTTNSGASFTQISGSAAQNRPPDVVGEYKNERGECVSTDQRERIINMLSHNRRNLVATGKLRERGIAYRTTEAIAPVTFSWPLAQTTDRYFNSYVIFNYVDHDASYPNHIMDYNCGTRSYDLDGGYNHQGTDISLWPFSWHSMEDELVEIIAAAPGVILGKTDGNYDHNCGLGTGEWNAVYIEHSDGTVAWYGHMKTGSTTSKAIGESVVAGEHLGFVGSSGSSTGPHLHFEVHDEFDAVIDPFTGPCNSGTSRWVSQKPYYESELNALLTHSAPPSFPTCPGVEVINAADTFAPGSIIYFAPYYHDLLGGQTTTITIYKPDVSVFDTWNFLYTGSHLAAGYVYWGFEIPSTQPQGNWKFKANFAGVDYYHNFYILALPAPISGSLSVCQGSTTTLSNDTTGGTWSSSNTSVATIGSSTGIVSGISSGTAIVTYTVAGGVATAVVTVNTTPAAGTITGPTTVSTGTTISLSNATTGGTWSSSNTSLATVGSTGIVTGMAAGTVEISYLVINSCGTSLATKTITVSASLTTPITGTLTVCEGATTTLSNATPGGMWSSGATSTATVGSGTGVVTGVTAGVATISYTLSGTSVVAEVTVNASPTAITGITAVCVGTTTTLNSTPTGGTWSSSNTAVAPIDASTGVVTGASDGSATVTYTIANGCYRTTPVSVGGLSAITGSANICVGLTDTFSFPGSGGVWSSSNAGIATVDATSGVVTGISVGAVTITYSLGGGCYQTKNIHIQNISLTLAGSPVVCEAATSTLSCTTTGGYGGLWTSADTSVATVHLGFGTVTGVSAGTTTITYTLVGCFATKDVTVVPIPSAITGTTQICASGTTTLTGSPSGGTWSSSNATIAPVNISTGVVSGNSAGTARITYSVGSGCYRTTNVTVSTMPAAITGTLTLCDNGNTTTLISTTTGGVWSSTNTSVATTGTGVSSSTVVTGLSVGTSTISYTTGGCSQTATVSVNAGPGANSGSTSICVGGTTTFTNGTSGGTWSSSATARASINSSTGLVTGLSAGSTTLSYKMSPTCYSNTDVTVNSSPAAISGTPTACIGLNTTLSHAVSGGTWTSSNTAVATIDNTTGVVTGVAVGTTTITYVVSPGCYKTVTVTVYGPPPAIGGAAILCEGAATTLTNTAYGGTWSSSNTDVATVGLTTGAVSGTGGGTAAITYQLSSTGCTTTKDVTVNALPGMISGNAAICVGSMDTLSTSSTGGTWTSSATAVAPVGSTTGIVNGMASGGANITYTLPTGCRRIFALTVSNPPATITGILNICAGNTITLTSTTAGQTWSSSNTAVATVGSATSTTGLVTGVSNGTAVISYTNAGGCARTAMVTVNAAISANTGENIVCVGQTVSLSNATSGGTWASSVPSKASVGYYTGVVTGVSAGTTNITYRVPGGCISITQVTVNAALATISGPTNVCIGQTIALSHTVTGGSWSTTSSTASVDGGGVVTGISLGYAYITYMLSSGCTTIKTIIVRSLPSAIAGPSSVAVGSYALLTDATSGGVWSSSSPSIASMPYTSLGYVLGVSTGSATITYTVPSTGCFVTRTMAVYVPSSRPASAEATAGETRQANIFNIYPNPTSGSLTITSSEKGALTLFTIDGKQVEQYEINKDVTSISLPNSLATGVYMCRFSGEEGSVKIVRLVFEH